MHTSNKTTAHVGKMELLIIIAITLLLVYIFQSKKNKTKSPPGPRRIPLFGSLPFLTLKNGVSDWALDQSVTMHKIATVLQGPRHVYVINDFELAKHLLDKTEFSGRPVTKLQLLYRYFN